MYVQYTQYNLMFTVFYTPQHVSIAALECACNIHNVSLIVYQIVYGYRALMKLKMYDMTAVQKVQESYTYLVLEIKTAFKSQQPHVPQLQPIPKFET